MVHSVHYSRTCVITVAGVLAGGAAATLRRVIGDALANRKIGYFVVDFYNVESIDDSGVESLLWASRQCESAGKRLKLVSLNAGCTKILENTCLVAHLEFSACAVAA